MNKITDIHLCQTQHKDYPLLEFDLQSNSDLKNDLFEKLADDDFKEDKQVEGEQLIKIQQDSMVIQQQQKSELQSKNKTTTHLKCKCSKIGCLKLYCQCFARGLLCIKLGICMGCENCRGNQKRILLAKQMANFRKPGSFDEVQQYIPVKKCTCKKSHCQKKYCQCFANGFKCTSHCQCIECYNQQVLKLQQDSYRSPIIVKG